MRSGTMVPCACGLRSMRAAAAVIFLLLSLLASATYGEQLSQQQHDALSSEYTWASLVDGDVSSSLQSSASPSISELGLEDEAVQQEDFLSAIETEDQMDEQAEAEADTDVDAEVDATSDSEVDATSTTDATADEEALTLLSEEESMAVLLELSDHMDVSTILEQEHHQQMFKPKAASAPKAAAKKPATAAPGIAQTPAATAATAGAASGAAKARRGPAASRLTKDVQAAKFSRFTAKQNRKYKTPAEAATAFQTFSKNREAIVALNDKIAPNRPAVFKSTGPFADKVPGQFAKTRTTAKINVDKAKGKAVRIKRRVNTGAGHGAGISGQSATQSGKTGGASGSTATKSGKTGGQSGGTGTKSGKTGGQSGSTATKSGKTGGQSGGTGTKSGKTGGDSGSTATKSGKTGGDSGGTGQKSGKTGGDSGATGKKSGKTGGTSGGNGKKSGKTGGTKNKSNSNVLQPQPNNDAVLPPTSKADKNALPTNIGVTADSIRASMKAAGVTDAEIQASFAQMQGEYKKGVDIGMDLFGYQRGTCGSCWAYAAADAVSRLWKKQRRWNANELIAVQQVLDCVHTKDSNGCNGGSPMDGIQYWTDNPVALMAEYPSVDTTGPCRSPPFGGRPNYKAAFGWEMSIPACTESGDCKGQIAYEHLLLAWLKGNSLTPIVYVDASHWQKSVYTNTYAGGIFPLSACSSTTAKGNHIVQIVGYGTEAETGIPYWVIRNSWSRSWGEDGQIRIPFGVNACGVMNFVLSVSDPQNSLINEMDPFLSTNVDMPSNEGVNPVTGLNVNSGTVEKGLSKSEILARLLVKSKEQEIGASRTYAQVKTAKADFDQKQGGFTQYDSAKDSAENLAARRQAMTDAQREANQRVVSVASRMDRGLPVNAADQKVAQQVIQQRADKLLQLKTKFWSDTAGSWIGDANVARVAANMPELTPTEQTDQITIILGRMRGIDATIGHSLNVEMFTQPWKDAMIAAFNKDPLILRARIAGVPGRDPLAGTDRSQLNAKALNMYGIQATATTVTMPTRPATPAPAPAPAPAK